jgi:hypothetical protein
MVNIAAGISQVLNNSPQVTALVAGEAGAQEQIKRQGHLDESRRFQEDVRSRVLSAEKSLRPGESEEEARRRLEERGKDIAILERRERRRRRAAEAPVSSAGTASPFEFQPVIDVCV